MDTFESLPCGFITEEQTGKHSLCKHLENLVFWSYNVQEKRGSMKKLTLENWQELHPYIALADYHEYNSNTVTMLMWTSMYEVYFETYPDYAIAYTCMPHREPVWLMPYCTRDHRFEAVHAIRTYSQKHGIAFEIHSMTKEFKNWLVDTYPMEFLIWDCYDARDYVYDRRQQETLSGKKMQKRRNHFHAFLKQYEGRFVYRQLDESTREDVYAFLRYWQSFKDVDDSISAEDIGIHLLLEHIKELPIEGGCIYIDGRLEAFNIASRLSKDMIQIHVEKANREIRGLYIAILKLYLETLEEDIVYVNREDDMGLPKLRKAKTDMQPVCKIQKFGSAHQALKIQQADAAWTRKIRSLWEQQFQEETAESTQFYFERLYREENCLLLVSEEELICMLQLRPMTIVLDGKDVRVPFIVGVATNPEYEGCGYMGMLLRYALKTVQGKAPFVLLQAYNWDLYKSFGFIEQYQRVRWKLKKQSDAADGGTWKQAEDAQDLLTLYLHFCEQKNGWRRRDLAYYKNQFLSNAAIWNQKIRVYWEDNQPRGYIVQEESAQELHIRECIYADEEALQHMMRYLAQEEKTVYVDLDTEAQVEGRRKPETCMMVKQLGKQTFPQDCLFIREEL